MGFTTHNNLEVPDTGTQNWDSSVNDNFTHLENGLTIKANAGETVALSEVTYIDGSGQYGLAIADGTIANRYIGIAQSNINRNADGYSRTSGHHLHPHWSFTPGNPIYLSASTPGALTESEPAESIIIGVALATNEITIRPWLSPSSSVDLTPYLRTDNLKSSSGLTVTGPLSVVSVIDGNWDANPVEVLYGGTGRDEAPAYAVVCGGIGLTTSHQSVSGLGTADYVLTSNGAGALPTWQASAGGGGGAGQTVVGSVIQTVSVMDGEVGTGSTIFPDDDNIPDNADGDEYMSLAITPAGVCNWLHILAEWNGTAGSLSSSVQLGLFQDATVNALAKSYASRNATTSSNASGHLSHIMLAGTNASTTFKIRAGVSTATTTTFNGLSSSRLGGGVQSSGIIIQEIQGE